MQKILILGNIGADAVRQNYQGKQFISFRVACTEKFTANGQVNEQTQWYDCSLNNADAKIFDYLKKGQKVFITGRPRYSIYDSQAHRCKMIAVNVFVESIELAGSTMQQQQQQQQQPQGGYQQQQPVQQAAGTQSAQQAQQPARQQPQAYGQQMQQQQLNYVNQTQQAAQQPVLPLGQPGYDGF